MPHAAAPPAVLTGIHNAVVIYNPRAGRMRMDRLREAQQVLCAAGIEAELWSTTGPGSATELAHRAVSEGRQLVICAGGDGTLNEIVNGLALSPVPLAVLPAGTANVLGKELNLPWSMPAAARLIPEADLRRIALGVARSPERPGWQRYFVCVAGAGPDGSMVYSTDLALKARIGILAYWLEAVRHVFTYRFPAFRVTSEGHEYVTPTLVVGRTRHYGGPVQITTQANLFEDAFEVMVSLARSYFARLAEAPAAFLRQHRKLAHMRFWKTTALRVEPFGNAPVYTQVDGESIGRLPIEFHIVPDALTLVVPVRAASR